MDKKYLFYFLVFFNLNAFSQVTKDSTRIVDCIPVSRSDETKWIQRFQNDIDRYVDENRQLETTSCDVLIFGSSSINLWKEIYTDLAPLKIIRRSYGGATIRDMIYNYDVIARGYDPRAIVMYVENDIADITVGDIYDLFRVFTKAIKRDYPDIPFYIMSLKPSPFRELQLKKILALNALLEDYASNTPGVYYIDITKQMYDANGKIRKDIFTDDLLHINQKGYKIWAEILKPILMQQH
jgi:hypothetical protein